MDFKPLLKALSEFEDVPISTVSWKSFMKALPLIKTLLKPYFDYKAIS
jgi:hypothetical protein